MDDETAVAGLERLGLTEYEARVFVALQKLGAGTASEVGEVADVPRSQVYGAADKLDDRGLVETRQSTPTAYRPVSLDQARTRLLDQLQRTGAETFDYLETVGGSHDEEETEAIWLVNGSDAVASRTAELVETAEDRVLYAVDDPALLADPVGERLRAAATDLTVVVASADEAVLAAVADEPGLEGHAVPDDRSPEVGVGRVLAADDRALLLSVYSARSGTDGVEEVAFWSDDSTFAAVLGEFFREWLADPFA
ncbi:TrmB family transcriptional regulator [Halobacteriales archaeon Cl-PHB]